MEIILKKTTFLLILIQKIAKNYTNYTKVYICMCSRQIKLILEMLVF